MGPLSGMVQITYLNKSRGGNKIFGFEGAGGVGIWLVTLRESVLWGGGLGDGCFGAVDFYLGVLVGAGQKRRSR